jgi:hypothetical protein
MSKEHPFAHFTPLEQAGVALNAIRAFHLFRLPRTMQLEVERVCELVNKELKGSSATRCSEGSDDRAGTIAPADEGANIAPDLRPTEQRA